MSFSLGRSRSRVRGRHFKLFSDELPLIEFDKTRLDEYNVKYEKKELKAARSFRKYINNDLYSLPSLGTPEWDKLSESGQSRPNSYSPLSPLSPNFAKLNQKIKRRNTLQETKHTDKTIVKDLNDLKNVNDRVFPFTELWRQHMRFSKDAESNAELLNDDETSRKTNVENLPTMGRKSLFKELLEASAKETEKRDRFKQFLNYNDDNKELRAKPYRLRKLNEDNSKSLEQTTSIVIPAAEIKAHEVVSESNENLKPGILKRGVIANEANMLRISTNNDFHFKPKLIHPIIEQNIGNKHEYKISRSDNLESDVVKVSVYAQPPLNALTCLHSTKSKQKQKRVNFHKNIAQVSEVQEREITGYDLETKVKLFHPRIDDSDFSLTFGTSAACATGNSIDNEHVYRTCILDGAHHESRDSNDIHLKDDISPSKNGYCDMNLTDSRCLSSSLHIQSKLIDSHFNHDRKRVGHKTVPNTSEGPSISHDTVAGINNVQVRTPSVSDKHKENSENNLESTSATLNMMNDHINISTNESCQTRTDIKAIADFSTIFDKELGLNELPEEIDRRMYGEDLIKAYRFWDRKRKMFPGGLRKIEPPVERRDILKQYGNIKPYKTVNNQKQESKNIVASSNKQNQSNIVLTWV